MRRDPSPLLACLPGLALVVAALAGWSPTVRDARDYFAPLRGRTAAVLSGARDPFWNPDAGCGEPYFANPQTGLLYPPAWLALVLPAGRAVGAEAGLHLALLGLGCTLLARRLGASRWWAVAAGLAVSLAGPVGDTVGVLNNLDTLAWLPWVWWAALGGSGAGVAVFLAAAYLGAEPQLTALAAVVALTLAPRRRTVAGIALAVALVAVQAVPFAFWVKGGDRGPGGEAAEVRGAVTGAELAAMALPGLPLAARADRYVPDPAVPLWTLVLGLLALAAPAGPARRLALWSWALIAVAALAGAPAGSRAWTALAGTWVRYPGRLLFPAVTGLAVAAAAAAGAASRRRLAAGAGVLVLVVAAAAALGAPAGPASLQVVTAGAALAGPWAPAAAVAGALALAPRQLAVLRLSRADSAGGVPCLGAQRGPGRTYTVAPSADQLAWVRAGGPGDRLARETALGFGYTALDDGRRMVRTYAPVASAALVRHLSEADRGPSGRWWLDSLGARRIVAQHPVAPFPVVCAEAGLQVMDDPRGWPEAMVVRAIPAPGDAPVAAGEVLSASGTADRRRWRVRVAPGGGVLLLSGTPDPGWRWRLDGLPVRSLPGPGILHGVPVAAGEHVVDARYRPMGLWAGGVLTLLGLAVAVGGAWRHF